DRIDRPHPQRPAPPRTPPRQDPSRPLHPHHRPRSRALRSHPPQLANRPTAPRTRRLPALTGQASSRTLLLAPVEEWELVGVDGLAAGAAAAGPAAQDGLH